MSDKIDYSLMCFVLENSEDEIYLVNKKGKVLFANDRACRSLGIIRDEIINENIDFIFYKPCNQKDNGNFLELQSENEGKKFINIQRRKDGTQYFTESYFRIFNFKDLEIFSVYSRDITDKINYEESLKNSEKEKTIILNSIHENLVYYDKDFSIKWANQDPADSVGLNPVDLIGKKCYSLWYNREEPCRDCTIRKAMREGRIYIEEKTKSSGRSVKVAAYPVFNDEGEVVGAVESLLDITKRKNAEKALEISEKQYKELFSTMTNGFVLNKVITDSEDNPVDYQFIEVNPAFEQMTGLKAEDIIGKNFLEIFPNCRRDLVERYGRIALSGVSEEFTDYNPFFKKHYHIYSYSPKKGFFAIILSDITDLVLLKKQQRESLEQINKNFEQLAILNDEIRNPLQAIMGYIMLEDFKYSEKVISQIEIIDKLVNRLDQRWLESEKIRDFLRKHYDFE
ncbi:PAS domain-containing protein [Methanochimaera problematica]|nr:PAS domain S-box protein [Methanoplanus sp. FWC-SCC4]